MVPFICLVFNHTNAIMGGILYIELDANMPVAAFLEEVQRKRPRYFPSDIYSEALIAWKPNEVLPSDTNDALVSLVDKLNLNSETDVKATKLDAGSSLQRYFRDTPPLGSIHIIVQIPQGRSSVYPPQVDAQCEIYYGEINDKLDNSWFVRQAPSSASKPSNFSKWQRTEDCLLNDRPVKDVNIPPIALLYPPFGGFIDHIRNRPEKQEGVDLRGFQIAVDEFAAAMCDHYKDESERQRAVLPILNGIFRCYKLHLLPDIAPGLIKEGRMSDGHAVGPNQVMETVVEIKNEFGSGQTDPEIQFTSYFIQMNHHHMKNGPHEASFKRFLCPALGIMMIGNETRLSYRLSASALYIFFRLICWLRGLAFP